MMKQLLSMSFVLFSLGAFGISTASADEFLADRHAKLGFKCETCHAGQATPSEPPMEACTGCHQIEALVEKTKNVKPTNPHTSPHYGKELDCTNCHLMHQESENFCNQCHEFKFQVP